MRALRRIPAVSISRYFCPWNSKGVSIASRVVPGTGLTITRSTPSRALTSEDFPTLGRPMTARERTSSGTGTSSGLRGCDGQSGPQFPDSQTVQGGDRQQVFDTQTVEFAQDVFPPGIIDFIDGINDRLGRPAQPLHHHFVGRGQARLPSPTKTIRSASSRASSICSCIPSPMRYGDPIQTRPYRPGSGASPPSPGPDNFGPG